MLRIIGNETALFAFLSISIITLSTDKQVICAIDNDAIFRQPMDREVLAPCSHEEADSGMMAHIADAANTYNSIVTGTMDSNIVVLAVYAFCELTSSLNQL